MAWLGADETSCRAALGRLRVEVAEVELIVAAAWDGVIMAAGKGLLMVEDGALNAALWRLEVLMEAWLQQPMARSCGFLGLAQIHTREA